MSLMDKLISALEHIKDTLEPVRDREWHGKWRVKEAIESMEAALIHAADTMRERDALLQTIRMIQAESDLAMIHSLCADVLRSEES